MSKNLSGLLPNAVRLHGFPRKIELENGCFAFERTEVALSSRIDGGPDRT